MVRFSSHEIFKREPAVEPPCSLASWMLLLNVKVLDRQTNSSKLCKLALFTFHVLFMLLKKLQQKDYTKAQKTHNKEKPPVYAEIEFLTIYCLLIKITQNKIQVIFKENKKVWLMMPWHIFPFRLSQRSTSVTWICYSIILYFHSLKQKRPCF